MRRRLLITIGVIILLIVGYMVISISRYMYAKNRSERDYYSQAARIPSFAECIEDHQFASYHNRSYVFLQTRKYRSLEKLCDDLPAGFTQAVNVAVTSGRSENAVDIKGKPVVLYEVSPELLPLTKKENVNDFECYYCVMEYPDYSYRFTLITDIAFTR